MPLHNYIIGLNQMRIKVYISAEIRPDSLDKGERVCRRLSEFITLGY